MGVLLYLDDPYKDSNEDLDESRDKFGCCYSYFNCIRRAIIIMAKVYFDNKINELVKQYNDNNDETYTVDECINDIKNNKYYCDIDELDHISDLIKIKKIFNNILDDNEQKTNYNNVKLYEHDEGVIARLVRTDLYGTFKLINHSDCDWYFSKGECVDINNTLQLINKTFESLRDNGEITENEYEDKIYKNKVLDYEEDLIKLFAQAVKKRNHYFINHHDGIIFYV